MLRGLILALPVCTMLQLHVYAPEASESNPTRSLLDRVGWMARGFGRGRPAWVQQTNDVPPAPAVQTAVALHHLDQAEASQALPVRIDSTYAGARILSRPEDDPLRVRLSAWGLVFGIHIQETVSEMNPKASRYEVS